MSNTAMTKQIETTVRVIVALATEPRIKAHELAEAIGVTPNYIAQMLMRLRQAGIDIEYDFKEQRYVGKFSEQFERGLMGAFLKKFRRQVLKADFSQPPVKFVDSLERYELSEFAEKIGTSRNNVYNMISGYKGLSLPPGWIAIQREPRKKWMVQKMPTDRSGKRYELPKSIEGVHKYVVGGTEIVPLNEKRSTCGYPECENPVFARGLCNQHYYRARRHPEKFAAYIQPPQGA
jgi:plasmid maintenance system antidote protein VapI